MSTDEPVDPLGKLPQFDNYSEWLRAKDLQQGVIRISDEIADDTARDFLSELRYLVEELRKPEIVLRITSPGGGAYHAFAMYDAVKAVVASGTKVTAIVEGIAASAASMIVLQAASERLARKNARFLIHEARRWVFFSIERGSDMKDEMKEMDAIHDMIFSILAERSGKTKEEVTKLIERHEVWMSAPEAKEWGLIDEVI